MFSWSHNSGARRGNNNNSRYPGQQQQVAQTLPGSIRPPAQGIGRAQHIESYVKDATLKVSTRKLSKDDSTYDTVFQTTQGNALILRVHMPPSNSTTPQMTLVGVNATHAWLDARMKVVNYSPIQSDESWASCNLFLNQAVHAVVKHFQLNPPHIIEFTDKGLQNLQTTMGGNASSSSAMNASSSSMRRSFTPPKQHQQPAPPDYESLMNSLTPPPPVDMPHIPTHFPAALDDLTREELQGILDSRDSFQAILNNLPSPIELETQHKSIVEDNIKRATGLMEQEEEYKILHGELSDLSKSFQTKLETFQELEKKQSVLAKPVDEDFLKKKLNKARKQAMDESEDYAMEWVEGGNGTVNVLEFLKEFLAKRNLMHVSAAKMERLEQQQQLPSYGSF